VHWLVPHRSPHIVIIQVQSASGDWAKSRYFRQWLCHGPPTVAPRSRTDLSGRSL